MGWSIEMPERNAKSSIKSKAKEIERPMTNLVFFFVNFWIRFQDQMIRIGIKDRREMQEIESI